MSTQRVPHLEDDFLLSFTFLSKILPKQPQRKRQIVSSREGVCALDIYYFTISLTLIIIVRWLLTPSTPCSVLKRRQTADQSLLPSIIITQYWKDKWLSAIFFSMSNPVGNPEDSWKTLCMVIIYFACFDWNGSTWIVGRCYRQHILSSAALVAMPRLQHPFR